MSTFEKVDTKVDNTIVDFWQTRQKSRHYYIDFSVDCWPLQNGMFLKTSSFLHFDPPESTPPHNRPIFG